MTTTEAIKQLQTEHDLIAQEHDIDGSQFAPELLEALAMAIEVMQGKGDTISRQAAIEVLRNRWLKTRNYEGIGEDIAEECEIYLKTLPSAQPELIRCKDCKYWRQQTNYAGAPLSFGFCESDEMWRSLYGETCEVSHIDTDDDFYCGYAERRTE